MRTEAETNFCVRIKTIRGMNIMSINIMEMIVLIGTRMSDEFPFYFSLRIPNPLITFRKPFVIRRLLRIVAVEAMILVIMTKCAQTETIHFQGILWV